VISRSVGVEGEGDLWGVALESGWDESAGGDNGVLRSDRFEGLPVDRIGERFAQVELGEGWVVVIEIEVEGGRSRTEAHVFRKLR
jgi:hypothetical protein